MLLLWLEFNSLCCSPSNRAGYVKLPPEKFAQKKQGEASKDLPTEPKKLQLNSAEELYAEIRDKNFNAVGAALSKKAKIISAAFEVSITSSFFFVPSMLLLLISCID